MSWVKEFKEYAVKGNMMDLAIGLILGVAFGKVVSSLVSDVLMPPIGLLLGGVDFSALSIKLPVPLSTLPPVEIKYGLFINTVISFLVIALAIFFVIKGMNKLRSSKKAPLTKECPECLMAVPKKAKKCGHCCSTLP
ncbi:large-conductance mechanosensitive channel protein MscL [Chlamydiota bacterium]